MNSSEDIDKVILYFSTILDQFAISTNLSKYGYDSTFRFSLFLLL